MNAKILLADDEKDILDLLENVLRKDGFQSIQRAETGMGALNACREFQPDVVILDIMLPVIDGLEVCRKIREFPTAPFSFYPPEMMISIKSSVFPAAATIILPSPSAPVRSYSASRRSCGGSSTRKRRRTEMPPC